MKSKIINILREIIRRLKWGCKDNIWLLKRDIIIMCILFLYVFLGMIFGWIESSDNNKANIETFPQADQKDPLPGLTPSDTPDTSVLYAKDDKKEWKVEKYDDVKFSDRHGEKYYRDTKSVSENGNRLWWSKDNAGHGGSRWKVYEETNKGLEWYKDADKYGQFIKGKHKGDVGRIIEWKNLRGVNDPKIIKGK